jgi:2-hydroxychromene-2-carboxylate isomerase
MSDPLTFHFDFSSPYGYLASTKIDALGAKYGREVIWKPFLIGATFKITGLPSLVEVPLKGDYARHDFARSARFHGVPYNHPEPFPIATQAPARAFYWVDAQDKGRAKQLAVALLKAYFVDGINISNPADTVKVAKGLGHDAVALETALNDPAVKALLKNEVDAAMTKGVFGSPFVFVDGEAFWGIDRFDQIERWLATGGF